MRSGLAIWAPCESFVCVKCGKSLAIIIEQIVSGASEATGSCENNATLSKTRLLKSQVASCKSRKRARFEVVDQSTNRPFGHLASWALGRLAVGLLNRSTVCLFIPRTHLDSVGLRGKPASGVEKRMVVTESMAPCCGWVWGCGCCSKAKLMIRAAKLTSDLFLGTKYYNDQRCGG